jgi:hypothetical protein
MHSVTIRRYTFPYWKQATSHFEDTSWVCDLAFLTDICGHLNDLNSKQQGKYHLVSELCNNVLAFWMKLSLLHSQLSNNITYHFTDCHNIFQQHKMVVSMSGTLNSSSSCLQTDLRTYKDTGLIRIFAKVGNVWACASASRCIFMVWCLVNQWMS